MSIWRRWWSPWGCPCSCWPAKMQQSMGTQWPPHQAYACWWATCCLIASPPTGRGSSSPSTRCLLSRWWLESTSSPASSPLCLLLNREGFLSLLPSCCVILTLWSIQSSSASALQQGSYSFFTPLPSLGQSHSLSSWPCDRVLPFSCRASPMVILWPSLGSWAFWSSLLLCLFASMLHKGRRLWKRLSQVALHVLRAFSCWTK